MKNLLKFFLLVLLTETLYLSVNAQQFQNTDEAVKALGSSDYKVKDAAIEYLTEVPKKSVPILKKIIRGKEDTWNWAMFALNKISKESAVILYIKLLEENFYEKEKDGTRKIYGLGTKNGCFDPGNDYGSGLAMNLAWLGDKRAIPVLKEAFKQAGPDVRRNALYALFKLDDISLQNLFDLAKQEKEIDIADMIISIGAENIHTNNEAAIKIFDQIIEEFPNDNYKVASAHFWKIQCYELLQMFDKALVECDEVSKYPTFVNLTDQVIKKKEKILLRLNSQRPVK